MTVEIYRITFNSNHKKVAMKTTLWVHEDVLNYFNENIIAYAKKMGFVQYTEQGNFRGNCRYFQKRSPEGLVCNTNKYNYWNDYK